MMAKREARAMLRVMQQHPALTAQGFDSFWPAKLPAERRAKFDADRAELFAPGELERFGRAIEWLSRFDKRETFNQSGTSYGLKHVAEREIGHTTNGVFIAAAVAAGFDARPAAWGSPNAVFKICTAAWRRDVTEHEHERLAVALGRAAEAIREIDGILADQRRPELWEHQRRAVVANRALFGLAQKLSYPKGRRAEWSRLADLYHEAWRRGVTVGAAGNGGGTQ
jgi:hypothetical protein